MGRTAHWLLISPNAQCLGLDRAPLQAINLARASGETLQDIGSAAGVSAERIRQIVAEKS
jgi:hypothetical protein